MSFKTRNFEQSQVMRELERLHIEKNPSKIEKVASQEKEVADDFYSGVVSLAKELREKGFVKEADSLDEKIAYYSIEEVELTKTAGKDGGEILLDFAHENDDSEIAEAKEGFGKVLDPVAKHKLIVDTVMKDMKATASSYGKTILDEAHDGDVEIAPAKDGLGVVETLQSAHKKILEIALKSAKGDKKAKAELEEIGNILKVSQFWWEDPVDISNKVKFYQSEVFKLEREFNDLLLKEKKIKETGVEVPEYFIKEIENKKRFLNSAKKELQIYTGAKEKFEKVYKPIESKKEEIKQTPVNTEPDWSWWKRNVAGKIQRLSSSLKGLGKDNVVIELKEAAIILLQSNSWEEAKKELSSIDASYNSLNSIKDLDNIIMRWEAWVKKNKIASVKNINKLAQSVIAGPEAPEVKKTNPVAPATTKTNPSSPKTQKVKFEQYRDFVEQMRAKPENTAWMDSVSKMQEFLSSFGNSIRKDYPQTAQKLYGTSIAGSNAVTFDGLWGTYTNKAIDAFNEFAKNTGVVLEKQSPFNRLTLDDSIRKSNITAANNNIQKIQEAANALKLTLSKPKEEQKSEYLINVPSDDLTKMVNISEFKQDSALAKPIKESQLNSFKSLQDFVVNNGTTPKPSNVDSKNVGFTVPEWKQILNNFRALAFKEKNKSLLDKVNSLKEKLNQFSKYIISTLDDESYSIKDVFPGSFIDSKVLKSEKVDLVDEVSFKNNPALRDAFYRYRNVSQNDGQYGEDDKSQGMRIQNLENSFWLPLSNPRVIPTSSLNKLTGRENFNPQIMYNNLLQSRNAPVSIIRNILNPRYISQVNAGSVGTNTNLAQNTIKHIEYLRTALTNQINEARAGETGWSENEINRADKFVQQWNQLFNTCIFALDSYIKNNA